MVVRARLKAPQATVMFQRSRRRPAARNSHVTPAATAHRPPFTASGDQGTSLMHTPPVLHKSAASTSHHAPVPRFMVSSPLQKEAASPIIKGYEEPQGERT